ncbi:hypothetical protein AMECASPLE_010935, partial [Ameca splendens]
SFPDCVLPSYKTHLPWCQKILNQARTTLRCTSHQNKKHTNRLPEPDFAFSIEPCLDYCLLERNYPAPVHPPSIAPTTETLGPSIILAHQYSVSSPTGKQLPGLSTPLWRISPSNHWYPGSSFLHISTYCT